MVQIKEFMTAALEVSEEDADTLEFNVDGVMCKAYPPGDGQLAVLMAMTGKHSDGAEQMAGTINFFASVLDEETNTYIVNKLLDRNDKFGIAEVSEILEWMVSEWSARPTKSPSASSSSRKAAGPKSRQSIQASS